MNITGEDDLPSKGSTKMILFPWLYDGLERALSMGKFVRTCRAISNGSHLYDESDEALDKMGYLRPLRFNLYQSGLSSLPGIIVVSILTFLFASDPSLSHGAKGLIDERADLIFEKLWDPMQAATVPFALLLTAMVVARASLRKKDRSPTSIARLRRAYLFFDGYYGLLPQALVGFYVAALGFTSDHPEALILHPGLDSPVIFGSIFLRIAFIIQLVITFNLIPEKLFWLGGYYAERVSIYSSSAISGETEWKGPPPKVPHFLATLVVAPLLALGLTGVSFLVARGIALSLAWVQGLTNAG